MNYGFSLASLTHHPVLKSIILIRAHPKGTKKTLVKIFADRKPFDKKQEIVLDFLTYHAIETLDRRSTEEQETNRFVVIAL